MLIDASLTEILQVLEGTAFHTQCLGLSLRLSMDTTVVARSVARLWHLGVSPGAEAGRAPRGFG